MQNSIHIVADVKFDFFERIKILFGRTVSFTTTVITDKPFEKANGSTTVLVTNKTQVKQWKNKPDITETDGDNN
jgi:hypothetical protein